MSLTLILSHAKNPDIAGGYWQEPVSPGKAQKVFVRDTAQASDICRAYIGNNGLGGGNWTGGKVYDGRKLLGRVAYNGRFFPADYDQSPAACLARWEASKASA